ncbi:protein FAM170A-like [Marmota monax]|uniref:protein FAM170A-like n=1 Tax=Marmota monax TaxID=9995 RepID=UPI0026F0FF81|nr:protein FAM170A-like [Marmota monax]
MPQYLLLFHSPDFQKWKSIVTKKYMLEAARTQAAVVNSSDSEYFTCVSTSSKLLPTEERDFQYWKESAIAPYMLEAAGENSSDSEYFSCLSPPSKTLPTDEYDFQKRKGIATEPFILEATRTQAAEENSCDSKYFTCLSTSSKLIPPEECGLQKFQEIVPKSYMLEPVRDQAAGDNSSSSDYLTSISFDSTLTPNDNQETSESSSYVSYPESHSTSVESKLEESEYSSSLAYNELPVYLANNPCTCSKKRKRERIMKVYYMHVRMKRGVAALEDTEDERQPPCKKTKMKTIAFPETIHTEENLSVVSTEELLTESDLSFDDVVQEASEDNDRPIDLPPLETSSRAKTPEWLVAHDSGYRCMACCRVFPSLEILQDHVKNGIKEGFSCHSFHVALNLLRSKNRKRKKEVYEEEENKVKKSWTKGISIQCHNIIRRIRDFFHNNH